MPFEVGELYNPNRTTWPETAQVRFLPGWSEFLVTLKDPTADEIGALSAGRIRLAWWPGERVSLFLVKAGDDGDWAFSSYDAHRTQGDARRFSAAWKPGEHVRLAILLVDAGTGIIRARRAVTIPPQFNRSVNMAIIAQLRKPRDEAAAAEELSELLAVDPDELAAMAPHVAITEARSQPR